MFQKIRELFVLPEYEDEDQNLAARLLSAILTAIVGLTLFLTFPLALMLPRGNQAIALQGVIALLFSAVLYYLLRSRRVVIASWSLISLFWALNLLSVWTGGGIRSSAYTNFILLILTAGLLLGARAGVFFTILSGSFGFIMVIAENRGFLTIPIVEQTTFTRWFGSMAIFVMIALLQGFASKITRQALRKARDAEVRYRTLVEQIPAITYMDHASRAGVTEYVSPQVIHLLGVQPEEWLKGKIDFWLALIHPDDREAARAAYIQSVESGIPFNLEYRMLARDGKTLWVHDKAFVLPDEHGKPEWIHGVIFDITERKRMEQELRLSEERHRLVSSVISDYSFSNVQNENGDIVLTWAAGAFEKISGYTLEEFNARGGWVSTVHPDDLEQDARDMEMLELNQKVVSDIRTIHKDGTIRWVKNYAHPIWDEAQKKLVGIYGAVQDITEQKRIEQERESLIKELEAKNTELEQFTYTVSHDLKAPIITIKGFLGFLADDALKGNRDRLEVDIRRISEATDKMYDLLNDLLELSRVGRVMNDSESVDFHELIVDAEKILQSHLHEHAVNILVNGQLPMIQGDRQRLLEVVQNLLDNAIKFLGDQKSPTIEIGQHAQAKAGFVTFYVRDNGIGIAPQYHERIFGLFNRLDPKVEGTGIGLALVKRIIEFHGGKIWVESEVDQGATFFFILPQAK